MNLGLSPQRRSVYSGLILRKESRNLKYAVGTGEHMLLRWAAVFLVIALIAAILGFGGIAGAAADIAKFLFFLFIAVFLIILLLALFAGKKMF
jgi:uncharacterized membrane protein YtjA (UPF0391 family)